jgi:hypothetical protein
VNREKPLSATIWLDASYIVLSKQEKTFKDLTAVLGIGVVAGTDSLTVGQTPPTMARKRSRSELLETHLDSFDMIQRPVNDICYPHNLDEHLNSIP